MAFQVGDIVVLSAGSMRMAVESIEGDKVHTVWCHEGTIGRDTFSAILLRKWEVREDDSSSRRHQGDGYNKGRPYGGDRGDGGGHRGKGKPGWDGKPRQKTHFRKD